MPACCCLLPACLPACRLPACCLMTCTRFYPPSLLQVNYATDRGVREHVGIMRLLVKVPHPDEEAGKAPLELALVQFYKYLEPRGRMLRGSALETRLPTQDEIVT